MTSSISSCEKETFSASRRNKRDRTAIRAAMLNAAGADVVRSTQGQSTSDFQKLENVGLLLGTLEDQRWGVSPPIAQAKLREAGLPYEGRRAGLIYSWPSIFQAEGIDVEVAKNAARETHPHLFDDLVDTATAASLLGFRNASSIRKLIIAGELTDTAFVRFGTRGVYRFRPGALTVLRKRNLQGRVV